MKNLKNLKLENYTKKNNQKQQHQNHPIIINNNNLYNTFFN